MTVPPLPIRHWPGDPDRPALAVHAMMAQARAWSGVARHLHGRVDLRAPDLPGHGRAADWRRDGPDFHTDATRAVAALIDRPVDLIGHSFGATVALRIAVAAPEAIRSLTLIEPVLFAAAGGAAADPATRLVSAAIEAGEWDRVAEDFLSVWGRPQPATDRQAAQARLMADTAAALHDDSAGILRDDRLEALDAPVLLIAGQRTLPVIAAIHEALAARLPDVGRATIPDAGHLSVITHPREVAGLIAVNLDRA